MKATKQEYEDRLRLDDQRVREGADANLVALAAQKDLGLNNNQWKWYAHKLGLPFFMIRHTSTHESNSERARVLAHAGLRLILDKTK